MERPSLHAPIESKDNKYIRFIASLSDPKTRKKEKAYTIEGVKMVEEALRNKSGVKIVAASPSLMQHRGKGLIKLAEQTSINIIWISDRLMDRIAESKTPQPVLAVVKIQEHSEEELLARDPKLIIIAHRLQDPGNIGTIIRTAEAVGASGIAVAQNTVDVFHTKSIRASMGSILRLPVVKIGETAAFVKKCRGAGFQVIAMDTEGEKTHFETDMTKASAVIVGQEGTGLPDEIAKAADIRVRIPMAKTIDSLNVATSAAVVLYEALRQRSFSISSPNTSPG